jgi:hypothetical protein
MSTRNLILISGGPSVFDPGDREHHDRSWSNFVDCPLLLSKKPQWIERDESVFWFIYKPSYVARWQDDVAKRRESTTKITGKGFSSYEALLTTRASEKGWKLKWIESAADFWSRLRTFNDPISRVFYWGHARNDLWLSLNHQNHVACEPEEKAVLRSSSITANQLLKPKFQKGDPSRLHRFVGCNTMTFAREWARVFGVFAEGVTGKVDFESIFDLGGEAKLSPGATRSVSRPI